MTKCQPSLRWPRPNARATFPDVRLRASPCAIDLSPDRIRVTLEDPAVVFDAPAVVAIRYDGKRRRAEILALGDDVERMYAAPELATVGRVVTRADAWYPPEGKARLPAAQAAAHDGEILVVWPLRDGFDPLAFQALLERSVSTAVVMNEEALGWVLAQGIRKLRPCAVTHSGPALAADQHDELVRSLWALTWANADSVRLNGEPPVLRGSPRRLGDLPRDEKIRLAVLGSALLFVLWLQRGWLHHPGHTWQTLLIVFGLVIAMEVQSVRAWLRS